MGFGKGGVNKKACKPPNKAARMEEDSQFDRLPRKRLAKDSPLSEREDHGLIAVTEAQIRTYAAVAYIIRFNEPIEDEWNGIAAVIAKELDCDKRTVLSVFERVHDERDAVAGINAAGRSGRPHKLPADNPGLAAAAMALNSNLSVSVATEICNNTNRKIGVEAVSSDTVIRNLREYTVVLKQCVLRRKTGSRDEQSQWAKACLARVTMTERMFALGVGVDANEVTMEDCKKIDIPPAWLDGMIFIDQSHMRAVPAGANGHDGSTSRQQWRVAINPVTGLLDKNGVLPHRVAQIKPKFDQHSQGCYAVCLPEAEKPIWLDTFNYTGRRMVSAKTADDNDIKADKAACKMKGIWTRFNGEFPYFDKYHKEGEEDDINVLNNAAKWEDLKEVMSHNWYQRRRTATKIASIKEFIVHTIAEGTKAYKGTRRQDTFMLWHDRLSILWEKQTQEWLKRLQCPIEGWTDRTWADRFVRIRGEYNDQVNSYYADSLPGDSPELMPLDCHLFSDIKEGVSRNVAYSFFLKDEDPAKYSLRSPKFVFNAIERTVRNGCPSNYRVHQDIMRIPDTLRRIREMGGSYIDDSSTKATRATPKKKAARHGVREESEQENKRRNKVDPVLQDKFDAMIKDMLDGKGLPFVVPNDDCLVEIEMETEGVALTEEDPGGQD